jgi:hypothetical protein
MSYARSPGGNGHRPLWHRLSSDGLPLCSAKNKTDTAAWPRLAIAPPDEDAHCFRCFPRRDRPQERMVRGGDRHPSGAWDLDAFINNL